MTESEALYLFLGAVFGAALTCFAVALTYTSRMKERNARINETLSYTDKVLRSGALGRMRDKGDTP